MTGVQTCALPISIPAEVQFIEKPVHEPAAAGAHEAWLLPIWQELLKVQDIRPERSFFDLGGHSLLAVRLVQRIEQQTGFRLPLADILRYPTIRSLSRRLEEVLLTGEVHSASLVPIRTEGDATPLFLVPGAGLHVLMYQTFADHLDKGFPIYALQAKGLDGKEEPLETVEGMAAFFIDQMKQIVPHGPYRLAGYSFGGLIVFEMAKQLREMGEPAEFVGLIDAVVRPEITGEDPKAWKQLQRKGKKLLWTAGFALREPGAALQYATPGPPKKKKKTPLCPKTAGTRKRTA